MKFNLAMTVAGMVLATVVTMTTSAGSKTDRINIHYVPPKDSTYQWIYTELKQRGALEKLQALLSPFRLPSTLDISLDECGGEPDAFYDYSAITICYEFIHLMYEDKPQEATPLFGATPIDTVLGPMYEVSLHEFAHALFDMLELPVFGREEDAADQVATYLLLQFGESEARRLIIGAAWAYDIDEKRTGGCRPLEDYAGEHGTPAQRVFNELCIAYGANPKLFGDVVSKGYLPQARAEYCVEEYEQVQEAFEKLIHPHVDLVLAEELSERNWLQEPEQ